MSLINEYTRKEQLLKQLSQELKELEDNKEVKRDLEFKGRLEALMKEFEKSPKDVLDLLAPPKQEQSKSQAPTGRRRRKLKVFKNPHTGEVVETRGGNQKTLKAWKDEHGDSTVESWLVEERD
ncbi:MULTISPECIES: histone-like nucleoid-structuring protein, MvaT/MvaU family [unclassified Modicisalibacter]|uniref:histone-like nucleoid-structuring protein, MvaT/MvaU family n=1 Tax=unclassified Modicisalibacter TaxID=2679913 RepID=UPI001CCF9E7D|nr:MULTISPECIES: histone-like nucleoid-structuring protein, MvaT/MvaU family [unclassified Modicisalibacter]MBZ9559114.1 DNA binding protein [Modicisalibacter sp. R2A 31.J]MBZ9576775.1 DNA binding protein [Modicisalibacter sp. MOD 31.J]